MASSQEKQETADDYALAMFEAMDTGIMTDTEMLRELVLGQRETRKLVKDFLKSMENNPMLKMMGKMGR